MDFDETFPLTDTVSRKRQLTSGHFRPLGAGLFSKSQYFLLKGNWRWSKQAYQFSTI